MLLEIEDRIKSFVLEVTMSLSFTSIKEEEELLYCSILLYASAFACSLYRILEWEGIQIKDNQNQELE